MAIHPIAETAMPRGGRAFRPPGRSLRAFICVHLQVSIQHHSQVVRGSEAAAKHSGTGRESSPLPVSRSIKSFPRRRTKALPELDLLRWET